MPVELICILIWYTQDEKSLSEETNIFVRLRARFIIMLLLNIMAKFINSPQSQPCVHSLHSLNVSGRQA